MERPFDYIATPAIERRDAATCARKVRECIAYIRKHNLTGERLDTWRGFVRDWRVQQRHYRRIERRALAAQAAPARLVVKRNVDGGTYIARAEA